VGLTEPLLVDGRLDEASYETIPPITGFIQMEPDEGQTLKNAIISDADRVVMIRPGRSRAG
jgi:hypothetical protein